MLSHTGIYECEEMHVCMNRDSDSMDYDQKRCEMTTTSQHLRVLHQDCDRLWTNLKTQIDHVGNRDGCEFLI